ncbi:MAG TPA: hypothetical protein VF056_08430 [Thermoleophilaceae bacterium]
MNKLCAAVALACALAAPAPAGAAPAASAAARAPSLDRAEAAARQAVAPLVVERAVCIGQARRRVVCFLAHPDAGTQQCRSVVLVRARRVRVLQSNVCFEFRKVTP